MAPNSSGFMLNTVFIRKRFDWKIACLRKVWKVIVSILRPEGISGGTLRPHCSYEALFPCAYKWPGREGWGAPFIYSQAVLAFCFQTPTKAKEHTPIVGKHPPTPPFLLSFQQHTPSRMSPGAICVWHTVCHTQNTHTCKMNHVYA